MVASIQTFGSYLNFHPHIHALVSDGVWRRSGEFSPLPFPETSIIEELFRRIFLHRLHTAERLLDPVDFIHAVVSQVPDRE